MHDDRIEAIVEDGEVEENEVYALKEYAITSSPNDFNVKTIVDFIDKGYFKISAFQRNYVWDRGRASRLIESLILGLPIPQIFLYEEPQKKNSFVVVDGQQRLMSIYYFTKMRFPIMEKRNELRVVFDQEGRIPPKFFKDDRYFSKFNLKLVTKLPGEKNQLHGLNYEGLGEKQTALDLRTIRCVIIKQNTPEEDDSSLMELFNRLNTGGINLTPQEIRSSIYNSGFMKMIASFNTDFRWRKLINVVEPDLRMQDIEVLIRGFAMLLHGNSYSPSMARFLNKFAKDMMHISEDELGLLRTLLSNFLDRTTSLSGGVFGRKTKKLNISIYESVFSTLCKEGYESRTGKVPVMDESKIELLKNDEEFSQTVSNKSTGKANVGTRLRRAQEILLG